MKKTLLEEHLVELGFSKHLMTGTGYNSINSMRDAVYYYKNGRITINATSIWTWFLDGKQRNDVAVKTIEHLIVLLNSTNIQIGNNVKMNFAPPLHNEEFEVIGIRKNEIEIQGDFSAGTHNVCQSGWYKKDLISKIL